MTKHLHLTSEAYENLLQLYPDVQETADETRKYVEAYRETLRSYRRAFGEAPPADDLMGTAPAAPARKRVTVLAPAEAVELVRRIQSQLGYHVTTWTAYGADGVPAVRRQQQWDTLANREPVMACFGGTG